MKKTAFIALLTLLTTSSALSKTIDMRALGLVPDTGIDMSARAAQILDSLRTAPQHTGLTLVFAPGRYNFHQANAAMRDYYISNHDQTLPHATALDFSGLDNLTVEGSGMEVICHGRMLPVSVTDGRNVTLRGISIDFAVPQIAQLEIVEVDTARGTRFRPISEVNWHINSDTLLAVSGEGWEFTPSGAIAFDADGHIVAGTGDLWVPTRGVQQLADGSLLAPRWRDARLKGGDHVAMRAWARPQPAVFVAECADVTLEDINVHYAEGMGLLAQLTHNITLRRFNVCRRGKDDPRYFTTQADATHFSQCSGHIDARDGLYEGMMDDAINVHGVYLKLTERIDSTHFVGRFMHHQAWGFRWGSAGDTVQIVRSAVMDTVGAPCILAAIEPRDTPTTHGVKEFVLTLSRPFGIDPEAEAFGIENLTLTPTVYFAGNVVRDNRARGALFSTPRHTVAENNLFDHTSGTAILLCGDCNGWYETGACRDVTIRFNRFVNALTSRYQFCNGVISIYPEIPRPGTNYFHGGTPGAITIEQNEFVTFETTLLFARSVSGLRFRDNRVIVERDSPFVNLLPAQGTVSLQCVDRADISF